MKIRYFSDIHLDFIRLDKIGKILKKIPAGIDEVGVIAGDIGSPWIHTYDAFIQYMSANFRKTFVIAGNHEYYRDSRSIERSESANITKLAEEYYSKTKSMDATNIYLRDYFRKYDNVTYLHNQFEHYENYCFIGTTLWSNITNPFYQTNDVHEIPEFDYETCNHLHEISVEFLSRTLCDNSNCIVITHHLPSSRLIDKKYRTPQMEKYNQWFSSDLDYLILSNQSKIRCWFYGHTHTPSRTTLHNVPFLCNPIGYPDENLDATFERIVDI